MAEELKNTTLGVCPNCKGDTVFKETKSKYIYKCGLCYKFAKQYKNGKIHWFKMSDNPQYSRHI